MSIPVHIHGCNLLLTPVTSSSCSLPRTVEKEGRCQFARKVWFHQSGSIQLVGLQSAVRNLRYRAASFEIDVKEAGRYAPKESMQIFHCIHQGNTGVDSNAYARILQRCIDMNSLDAGKRVHGHMIKTGFEPDMFVRNNLVNLYAKCGSVEDARHVFDKMPERDVVSWNAISAAYVQHGDYEEAWKLVCQMQREGMEPSKFTFASILRACAKLATLENGRQVHALIIKTEYESDVIVGSALVDMYAKCRSIDIAGQVFGKLPERNVVSWTAIIVGHSQNGNSEKALELFCQMQQCGAKPNQFTFASFLGACATLASLEEGKQAHGQIIKAGLESSVFVGSAIVDMYAKCRSIDDAWREFDKMPQRDALSWNAIITGYAQSGHSEDALKLFCLLKQSGAKPNQFIFASLVRTCASLADLEYGKQVHAHTIKLKFEAEIYVASALVDMYVKCGEIEDACQLFSRMHKRDVVSWTAIISGHTNNGQGKEALKLFSQMQQERMKPNLFTYATVISACASIAALQQGKQLHTHIIKSGFESYVYVGNVLVDMYANGGSMEDACHVFDAMLERDVISWTTIISGFAQHGHSDEALKFYSHMQQSGVKPNEFTFASVLKACACMVSLEQGKQVHAHTIKTEYGSTIFVGSSLVDMYAKCGIIEDALQMFSKMPKRNGVSWNSLIAGYAHNGNGEEALKLFFQMHRAGIKPSQFTFTSVAMACASLAAMGEGKQVHALLIKSGFDSQVFVASAIVDLYAKCGNIDDACQLFENMPERDAVSWNVMITGHAQHGRSKEALQLFVQMQKEGMKPDPITFVGVLSACSHQGLVNDGWHYFYSMIHDHGVIPSMEHYACMVDLLGRAGHLDEADEFVSKMPFKPGALVWWTLLGACRIHGNMELGKRVAEHLLMLEPEAAAVYVLLSNIYAAAGKWDDVAKVRQAMKDKGVTKEPGCSWIEIKNQVHTFFVGDRSHPQAKEIYAKLEELSEQMEEEGYVPDTNFSLHDVEQEQKQLSLAHHSEKLAIAFGIISTPTCASIRIIKNLRVCGDCHMATKYISKITNRDIVVRDVNRFHHFKDGHCSCGDFW
eukprot:Gb_03959 [translate_table: standard]